MIGDKDRHNQCALDGHVALLDQHMWRAWKKLDPPLLNAGRQIRKTWEVTKGGALLTAPEGVYSDLLVLEMPWKFYSML